MKAYLVSLTMILAILPCYTYIFNTSVPTGGKYIKEIPSNSTNYQIKTVVVDPGHGGKDSGCTGHNHLEKDIALKISKKFGYALKNKYPHIKVIYTRTRDVFVPLHRRVAIANKNQADLFISIHCNAMEAPHTQIYGTETYVMGLHKAEANLAVAKRENASILLEDNYQHNYQGFDPHSAEGHIILSMFQNTFLDHSILFAEKVEKHFKHVNKRKSRGVKQAGFLVLRETTMPAVLIEAGYLTNKKDNAYLASDRGQTQVANSILRAFTDYKKEVEENREIVHQPVSALHIPIGQKVIKSPPSSNYSVKKIYHDSPSQPEVRKKPQIQFKILLASTSTLADTRRSPWDKIDYAIQVIEENNHFKYYVVGFHDYTEATKAKKRLRSAGFKEAFVVAFQDGKRVDISQVIR